ncbi:MAG: hypothetical protein ACTSSQ_07645, partial [Alphaproteobacteria bacterium]
LGRCKAGEKAAFTYPLDGELSENIAPLVDFESLRYLNNKTNIPQLAGARNTPHRRMLNAGNQAELDTLSTPVALKVATDDPNAGGLDVAICDKPRHLIRALAQFANAETLIAEERIDAAENWCIQCAVLPDGTVCDIGASRQICLRNGIHAGNLIQPSSEPDAAVLSIARAIAQAGSARGFRGLCGFDILIDPNGKAFVIDLNFRPVSSAAFVQVAALRSINDGVALPSTGRPERLLDDLRRGPCHSIINIPILIDIAPFLLNDHPNQIRDQYASTRTRSARRNCGDPVAPDQ